MLPTSLVVTISIINVNRSHSRGMGRVQHNIHYKIKTYACGYSNNLKGSSALYILSQNIIFAYNNECKTIMYTAFVTSRLSVPVNDMQAFT